MIRSNMETKIEYGTDNIKPSERKNLVAFIVEK